jgi:hypothetical protein
MTDKPLLRPVPADGLLSVPAMTAVVVVILNDHVLKHAAPGWVTGKLSDVAGMAFFPLFLQAVLEVVQRARGKWETPRAEVLRWCCIFTAVAFASIKLFPSAAHAYRVTLGALQWPLRAALAWMQNASVPTPQSVQLVMDPTDLLAIPFVLVAWWTGEKRCT